jgi:hypothetical protein
MQVRGDWWSSVAHAFNPMNFGGDGGAHNPHSHSAALVSTNQAPCREKKRSENTATLALTLVGKHLHQHHPFCCLRSPLALLLHRPHPSTPWSAQLSCQPHNDEVLSAQLPPPNRHEELILLHSGYSHSLPSAPPSLLSLGIHPHPRACNKPKSLMEAAAIHYLCYNSKD